MVATLGMSGLWPTFSAFQRLLSCAAFAFRPRKLGPVRGRSPAVRPFDMRNRPQMAQMKTAADYHPVGRIIPLDMGNSDDFCPDWLYNVI